MNLGGRLFHTLLGTATSTRNGPRVIGSFSSFCSLSLHSRLFRRRSRAPCHRRPSCIVFQGLSKLRPIPRTVGHAPPPAQMICLDHTGRPATGHCYRLSIDSLPQRKIFTSPLKAAAGNSHLIPSRPPKPTCPRIISHRACRHSSEPSFSSGRTFSTARKHSRMRKSQSLRPRYRKHVRMQSWHCEYLREPRNTLLGRLRVPVPLLLRPELLCTLPSKTNINARLWTSTTSEINWGTSSNQHFLSPAHETATRRGQVLRICPSQ